MKYRIVTDHDGIFIVELQVTKVLSFGRERSEWKPVLYSNSLKKAEDFVKARHNTLWCERLGKLYEVVGQGIM